MGQGLGTGTAFPRCRVAKATCARTYRFCPSHRPAAPGDQVHDAIVTSPTISRTAKRDTAGSVTFGPLEKLVHAALRPLFERQHKPPGSSLDNVRLQPLPRELGVYVLRAEEGLKRLETILTRMGEATRLEQVVRSGECERFDARNVVAGSVEGYAAAYPGRRFALSVTTEPVPLTGAPDLFAQMLDKHAANAADFATGEAPIEISLERAGAEALLRFGNAGPLLPAETKDRLFESMVSVRRERVPGEPHLGLGLFIVRQITEFHGGKADAADRPDGSGVVFELRFTLAP